MIDAFSINTSVSLDWREIMANSREQWKEELIEQALRESKDFAKEMRVYLYDISKERTLTEQEQRLYGLTHDIHVHTNDALLVLND